LWKIILRFPKIAGSVCDLPNYTSTLSCSAGVEVGNAGTAGEFTVPVGTADGTTITCTFVNTRNTVDVVVGKSLAPNTDTGTFDLSINGGLEVNEAIDGSSNVGTPVSVTVEESFTVSEVAGDVGDLTNPVQPKYGMYSLPT
jgi:hypothetical protein